MSVLCFGWNCHFANHTFIVLFGFSYSIIGDCGNEKSLQIPAQVKNSLSPKRQACLFFKIPDDADAEGAAIIVWNNDGIRGVSFSILVV